MLLYKSGDSIPEIKTAVEKLTKTYKRVIALRELPEKISSRKFFRLGSDAAGSEITEC